MREYIEYIEEQKAFWQQKVIDAVTSLSNLNSLELSGDDESLDDATKKFLLVGSQTLFNEATCKYVEVFKLTLLEDFCDSV